MTEPFIDHLSIYMRSRFNLSDDWHVTSADSLDNGVLIYGVRAPLYQKGVKKGQPNFNQQGGRIWKYFLSSPEYQLAISGQEPDYQEAFSVEYAIALLEQHLQQGDCGLTIGVGIGKCWNRCEVIHAVVYALGEHDSVGKFSRGYLAERCFIWASVDCKRTYEIVHYHSPEKVRNHFYALGLPITQAVVNRATEAIKNAQA